MPATFHDELAKLTRAKKIVSMLPEKFKYRLAKKLYDYQSQGINGIDLVVPLRNEGLICFINTKDVIGWKIFFYGEYEQDTNRILAEYVKPGNVVIEAGANMGSETLLLSRLVGDKGHVYGFEPNPYVYQRLKINVSINELKNVDVYELAVGEKDTTIHFNIYPKGFCNPGMSSKYMETPLTRKISVQQVTLDAFVKAHNVTQLDFIKMDIQGAEMDAVQGARETLSRFKPCIFMEAYQIYNDLKKMHELLSGMGYSVFLIGNGQTEQLRTSADIKEGNWLLKYKK